MAKYYTDAASTPVFAVTFVSNRDGIVSTVDTTNDPNVQKRQDDINKQIQDINKQIADKEKEKADTPIFSDRSYKILEKIDRELKDLRANLEVLNDELKRITKAIKDTEYLIYSNLEIKNVGGSDLSQQSNWYLTEADVELTRDWPICKAKLVVTCKLNDDGTIPSIVQVEKGFTYDRDKDGKLVLTNSSKARLLSADDEVRIYAGYKDEPCITINDLDKYPYSFKSLGKIKKIDPNSIDGQKIQQLQNEKKIIEEAIKTLNNPLTDPVLGLSIAAGLLAAGGFVVAGGLTVGGTVVTTGVAGSVTTSSILARLGVNSAASNTAAITGGSATTAVARLNAIKTPYNPSTINVPTVNQPTVFGTTNPALTNSINTVNTLKAPPGAPTSTIPGTTAQIVKPGGQVSTVVNSNNVSTVSNTNTTIEASSGMTAFGFNLSTNTITPANAARIQNTIKLLEKAKNPEKIQIIRDFTKTLPAEKQSIFTDNFAGWIKQGIAFTSAFSIAAGKVLEEAKAETTNIPSQTQIKPRNYLEGRQSFKDNKDLKDQLELEIKTIDKLLTAIQFKEDSIKTNEADPNKLAPIFWGFIDTIDFIGSANSIQIIYNLRDRSRILADTKLITIPYLNENKGERGAFEGLRHKTLEGVYRAANGGIYLDNNFKSASGLKWREGFDVGEVITLYDNKIDSTGRRINDQTDKITEIYKDALAEQRIKFSAAIEDPTRWVIANSFLQASDIKANQSYNNYDPLFHIWTLQPPLVSGSGATTMQIINKSPFEILGYMQVTEVMPIDCYCSHVNGHFIFGPRILDTSGLDDVDRGNRTYFFFDCFDKLPESRSLIKNIRVQTSTIGVYNRFTVAAADFNNATNASLSDLLSIVDITPVNTRNRKIPIKQHIITDPKIAKEANKEGAAQALALTTASNMARDNTTIIMKVLGDSSFNPGEAIRVFNTVLHSKDTFTFNGQTSTSSSFLKTLYEQVEKIKLAPKAQVDKDKKIANLSQVLETIRDNSGSFTDDLNNVLPMYKVRAITHSLKATGSDAGFITKIVAIADIL